MTNDILGYHVKAVLITVGVWALVMVILRAHLCVPFLKRPRLLPLVLLIWIWNGLFFGALFYAHRWSSGSPIVAETTDAKGNKSVNAYFDKSRAPNPSTPGVRILQQSRKNSDLQDLRDALSFDDPELSGWFIVDLGVGLLWSAAIFTISLVVDAKLRTRKVRTGPCTTTS